LSDGERTPDSRDSRSSGGIYGVRLQEALRAQTDLDLHLILSRGAADAIGFELGRPPQSVTQLTDVVHDEGNLAASIASGVVHHSRDDRRPVLCPRVSHKPTVL
jgi:3-polyprenyl-4-hydroxybenzoate decarboxylase